MTELRSTSPPALQGSPDAELEAAPDRARFELEYLLAVGTRA